VRIVPCLQKYQKTRIFFILENEDCLSAVGIFFIRENAECLPHTFRVSQVPRRELCVESSSYLKMRHVCPVPEGRESCVATNFPSSTGRPARPGQARVDACPSRPARLWERVKGVRERGCARPRVCALRPKRLAFSLSVHPRYKKIPED
jgi:hypothetical protein